MRGRGPGAAVLRGVALVLGLAACTTIAPSPNPSGPSSPIPTTSPMPPTPTPRATVTRLPSIASRLDPQLTAWAKDYEQRTRAAEGRLVMGHTYSGDAFFAYDPTAGMAYHIDLPRGAESFYPFFADGLRVGGVLQPEPGSDVPPFTVFDLGTATVSSIEELPGFGLQVYGRNDGYAYGIASEATNAPSEPALRSDAFVADLASGVVTDVSPPNPPSGERFEARGVSGGRALVAWFAATSEVSAIHRLELVDIKSGARTDVLMSPDQLATISDAWDEDSLSFWDGHIFGYFANADLWPAQPFEYDVAAGKVETIPCGGWKRLDRGRFVCFKRGQTSGVLPKLLSEALIYDAWTGTTSPIPWPAVTEISVQGVGRGFVLREDGTLGSDGGPVVYDTRTGAMYRLDMTQPPDWKDFVRPDTFAILGDVVVAAKTGDGWTDGMFDPRVWPLP